MGPASHPVRQERAPRRLARARRGPRGLTLIEIIVVLSLIAVITAAALAGSNQLPSSRLKRSATLVASAIKNAYVRATATSHDLRLVLDLDQQAIWLEETEAPMLVKDKDPSAAAGAEAVTEAEKQAHEEADRIMKGPPIPKPTFKPVEARPGQGKVGNRALPSGITFRSVQTSHDDTPRTSGRAYLYFWPGGLTERAAIQVRIGDSDEDYKTLSLLVSPLTGRVTVKNGPVALSLPTDDEHKSERQDPGF